MDQIELPQLHYHTSSVSYTGQVHRAASMALLTKALIHISCVLKQSGTNSKKCGPMCAASPHISCVFRWSRISLIHIGVDVDTPMFIYVFKLSEGQKWWVLYQIILKRLSVTSIAFFHLLTYTNPSHDQDTRRWVKILLLFFLSVPCAFDNHCTTPRAHYHSNSHRHHTIHLSVRDKLQGISAFPYHIITYFLCFKVIRDMLQKRKIYGLVAHLLSFKTVRDTMKCIWHGTHYLVAHFLHPEVISNII